MFFSTELFFAQILPPCASTIPLQMYNPRPVPFSDFVANLVNSLGTISKSMPFPSYRDHSTDDAWMRH
jgi:hypothetical protein